MRDEFSTPSSDVSHSNPSGEIVNGIISPKEIKDKYQKALHSLNWEYREYWLNY